MMFQALKTVASLLLGAGILILGNGLVGIVLPVRMSLEQVPTAISGLVMSAYYGGLVLGCLWGQGVIARVGHIRAFAVLGALTCCLALAFCACARGCQGDGCVATWPAKRRDSNHEPACGAAGQRLSTLGGRCRAQGSD